ncbi:hypothetical protein ACQCLI_04910 [Pseudomonas nitroreducens]|uniref:hypothetical protein n=1 Tax=Pseudomonas nitroreducens TaxID=46680 RepID=UPI0002D533ED|nr:hypothetical protein [Pseudomonas nitroreducens]
MNPYFIKGPAQIGLSGGRTSGYMMRKILDAHNGVLPPDVHVFFQNTGKEVEPTLEFINEISQRWAVPVIWMEWCRVWGQPKDAPWYRLVDFNTASRESEPFDMMLDYYASYRREEKGLPPILPNFANNMCTAFLKIKIGEKHMRSLGYDHWDCVVGIRHDEPSRYHRMMAANARGGTRWEHFTPLYLDGVTKEQVLEFWSEQPFDLGIDSDLGNCDLCWKKSEDKLYRAIIEDPKRVLWWSGTEEKFGQVFRQDRPKYAHMGWYAERMATQEAFDFEAAGLVTEDIDCFCGD